MLSLLAILLTLRKYYESIGLYTGRTLPIERLKLPDVLKKDLTDKVTVQKTEKALEQSLSLKFILCESTHMPLAFRIKTALKFLTYPFPQ